MSIAIQTTIGDSGAKATTELSYNFNSMINSGNFQYGLNSSGIYILNTGNTAFGIAFEKSFTLSTTNFGLSYPSRSRHIYIKIELDATVNVTVSSKADKGSWVSKTKEIPAGVHTVKFSMPRTSQGFYHTIKVASTGQFKIHNMSRMAVKRPINIKGV